MTYASRNPAVAGRFYPGRADELLRDVRGYISAADIPNETDRIAAVGCVAPHAGYIYSGGVAGAVYSHIDIPARCVILCPNHTGRGRPLAIMADSIWRTPLGEVAPDTATASALLDRFPGLQEDSTAHLSEHAIEVQLPFLQTLQPELKIVPIAIGTQDFDVLQGLGAALAKVVAAQEILIVASSDMNHYEPEAITRIKDRQAIDCVLALDPRGLWEIVRREDISMCGLGPTVVMLTAAKLLGATTASLVKYATSGEVSGDYESVVGYAGIIVT
jgi:MEMO1 family protein